MINISSLINNYKNIDSSLLNEADNFLINFNNLNNIEEIIAKSNKIIESFRETILTNNLLSSNLVSLKEKAKNKINNSNILTNDEKEFLLKENEKIIFYDEYEKNDILFKKLEQRIDNKINELKLEIDKLSFSSKNKELLKEYADIITDVEQVNLLKENIELIINKTNELISSINSINEKINSNTFKNKYAYKFYKELYKFNNLVENNSIKNINILNLNENIKEIDDLISYYNQLISEESSDQNNNEKTVLELFKEETESIYNLENPNVQRYSLNEYSTSASFDFLNAKVLFDNFDTNSYNFEIVNLTLDNDDKNILNVEVRAELREKPEINYTFIKKHTFTKDINQTINDLNIVNLDQNYEINYYELSKLTIEQFNNLDFENKTKYFKPKSRKISKFFNYKLTDNFSISENKIVTTLDVMFNNQKIKSFNISTNNAINFITNIENQEEEIDNRDEQKILSIIKSSNISDLMSLVKIKEESKVSHINYLASDGIEAFHSLYELPKFGKFEIFIKELLNIEDYEGRAEFVFWYKKDGVEVPFQNIEELRRYKKRIGSFKFLTFADIKPKNNENFTAEDFTNYEQPSNNYLEIANSINESNFFFRKSWGETRNTNYRVINPSDLIEQKAEIGLEYMLDIKRNQNTNGGINYDNDAYVPLEASIFSDEIQINNTDLNPLRRQFFVYYYDLQKVGKRGMSFKLGYISKTNTNVRFTIDKRYTLINLVNDYQQALYPEIILNNIKLSDLNINKEVLATKKAKEFTENIEELNQYITINSTNDELSYKNYSLPVSYFKIAQIAKISGNSAYIKLKVKSKNDQWIIGNNWYKIDNFMETNEPIINEYLEFSNDNLKTIYESNDNILRERILEPLWEDLLWSLDEKINVAKWTLKKKYLEKTLLKNNSKNRYLKFQILGNSLVNDSRKNSRIRDISNSTILQINFDELIDKKVLLNEFYATDGNNKFKYYISVAWNENEGIKFKIWTEDSSYKIIINDPETQRFNSNQTKFDKNRAFVILPAAVKTTIKYSNDEENENFNIDQNRFDYKNIEYNEFSQPILFYSDLDFQKNKDVYYPNQNVHYKLHEGYKLSGEQLRIKQYRDWDLVESVYSRNLLIDGNTWFGTVSIIAKVNNDPNDATFYAITNNHVEGGNSLNFAGLTGNNFLPTRNNKKYGFAPYTMNNIDKKYNIRISGVQTLHNTQIKILWTGKEQLPVEGTSKSNQDLTVFIMDLNDKLRSARSSGNMQIVWKIENLMKKGNAKFDVPANQINVNVPSLREFSTLGWPSTTYAGSINRRSSISDNYVEVRFLSNYSPVFTGSGASGSGMYISNDRYFSTWQSGNGRGVSSGIRYDTRTHNYFGINWNNENPLTLNNFNSVASQIFKANLYDPNKYDLPWYLKEIKNEGDK
ncbi:Uncharacterised protein [Mycoplasmopsis maculosa]|uniref:Uncharacterized protein n=1 Tax=Mycoplasmopsis maculosa TaxID=114885 RepID=A0A449B4C3_9BACT|nr:hypothetical protein [Mycoplasmopsis maculosa]VEU75419.1 Uncharacterised protein [Mycoplasmopsis maculosa]